MRTNTEDRVPIKPGKCFASLGKAVKIPCVILLMIALAGCTPLRVSVGPTPVRPEDTGRFITPNSEVPVRVQIPNFEIGQVYIRSDMRQCSEQNEKLIGQHYAVLIPNIFQESIGKRQVFSEVTRVAAARPDATDYIVTGTYDYFQQLSVGILGRIFPLSQLGVRTNEVTARGTLLLRIVETKRGTVVFEKTFIETYNKMGSIYETADIGFLQAGYIGGIATEVIKAISDYQASR